MADLVLHIHHEPIQDRSEARLLHDLALRAKPATNGATR
jgi:hypothetical protein